MRLGELLQGGELILLDGQLGTGKTTFTQGLAQGMGITGNVNSPTFTLLKEHTGQLRPGTLPGAPLHRGLALYHFVLYRLDDPEEIIDLGFEDYFFADGVCVIKWPEKAASFWHADHLTTYIKLTPLTKRGPSFT